MRRTLLRGKTLRAHPLCLVQTQISTYPVVQPSRACSCSAPLAQDPIKSLKVRDSLKVPKIKKSQTKEQSKEKIRAVDHREIGTALSLFTNHVSSPGAPFFQPNGTHIFQKLISFLRAQYPQFGFREVLTPTIYKKALWEQSGHWTNYKDDMFTVTGQSTKTPNDQPLHGPGRGIQPKEPSQESIDVEEYGLKPMNCPGHCLLFQAERRSYRDLPIRYAEFSPLHRNEMSGALSGLTRVRRFHQDDGHIFCRPNQVKQEINECLSFIRLVYRALKFPDYRLVLSTRPKTGFIGTIKEWDRAEGQLRAALEENCGEDWEIAEGEGAFYGPKIDVIFCDSDGKKHQTGTVQLDFQLPKRFELAYESPAPEMEAMGQDWKDSESRATLGRTTPVMIHRAILGSLERLMALLLEHHRGRLPFWLSPNQIVILTVTDKQNIKSYAEKVKQRLLGDKGPDSVIEPLSRREYAPATFQVPDCMVDIDDSAETLAQKVIRAKKKNYNMICVVGERNVSGAKSHGDTVDLDVSAVPDQMEVWRLIEEIKPGSRAPVQKDKGAGSSFRGLPGVRLSLVQCRRLILSLKKNWC